MDNYYIFNNATEKIELHFDKNTYLALDDAEKATIRSNFLFSRARGAWVSRAKFPHLSHAENVAKKLNLTNAGDEGERLTFSEKQTANAERAEARAAYYETKADAATARGNALQQPIENMRGDIAFFTQPNINSSAGRAFTNRRNRMFAAWEKGFEEFKKSEYYTERAKTARATATGDTSKSFCQRRIDDAQKAIRAQKKNILSYEKTLERVNAGEVLKRYNGDILTADDVQRWIDDAERIVLDNIEKAIYYNDLIEAAGGVNYSKENIKAGYIVDVARWGRCEVVSTGPKNFTFKILSGGASGCALSASYADIKTILEEKAPAVHPFKVGERYEVGRYKAGSFTVEVVPVEIVKATEKSITIKTPEGDLLNRKPAKRCAWNIGDVWTVGVFNDCHRGYIEKPATAI